MPDEDDRARGGRGGGVCLRRRKDRDEGNREEPEKARGGRHDAILIGANSSLTHHEPEP
jgi:hypothetical protein